MVLRQLCVTMRFSPLLTTFPARRWSYLHVCITVLAISRCTYAAGRGQTLPSVWMFLCSTRIFLPMANYRHVSNTGARLLRWTVTSTVSGRNYPNHRDSLQNQRQSRYSLFIRDLIFSRHLWGGIKQFLFGVSCGREQARNYFFYLLYVEIITLRSFKLFYVKINFWSLEYTSAVLLITIHDWIIFQGYCKNFQK